MHIQCHGVIDWADDHSTCTVTLHCSNVGCPEPEKVVQCKVDFTPGEYVDCDTPLDNVYTASVHLEYSADDGSEFTFDCSNVRHVAIKGHDLEETGRSWADDYSSVTVTFVCNREGCQYNKDTGVPMSVTSEDITHTTVVDGDCESVRIIRHSTNITVGDSVIPIVVVQTIPAGGHEYTDNGSEEPTCDKPGVKKLICSKCGDTVEEPIPPTGHEWTVEDEDFDWADNHSTCTVTLHCNKCQETEEREADVTSKVTTPQYCEQAEITEFTAKLTVDEKEYTNVVSAQTKDALEHDWPEEWEVDTPADCTKNRIDKQECQRCGLERKQEVQETALGHEYTNWAEQTPATCTDPQILEQHCIRGDSSQTKTGDGPKGHQYSQDYQVTKSASCLQDGSKRRQCDVCGEWDVQSIPATGHPGYDQNYCCTVCGHLNVDAVAELAEQAFLQYMAESHPEMPTPIVDANVASGNSYVKGGYVTNHSYEEVVARASEAGQLMVDSMSSHDYLASFKVVVVDTGRQYDIYFYNSRRTV